MIMTTTILNSLARASSAYLRSAMHQPIRWHEWGEEAFASAQRDNKPMLLDIGAVWCHWCHVMDRESYDDPEVAAIVNEHFVAVKVDRDERPDIDIRYQAAVSALSGQGGWPLTAFLTPDGKPFYGGTYFPPNDGYGRPSFRRVLLSIASAYREKNGDVMEQAKMVENAIAQTEFFSGRSGRIASGVIAGIQESAFKMFDPQHGGFGQAPKFPHPSVLDLLIEQYARKGGESLLNLIVTTLEHMANGGVYDQLAGGFHRQLRTAQELRSWIPGHRLTVFGERGPRHHPLDGRVAERPRAGRLLRVAGCRHFHGRRRRLLHLDPRRGSRRPDRRGSAGCGAPLRHQRSGRDAPQSGEECTLRTRADR
jgi:uncharacterized protein YyaL (SSP411 family)